MTTSEPRPLPTGVIVAGIVCLTLLLLALIGAMGWLIYAGKDTAAMMTLVTATVVPLISALVLVRVERVGGTIETVRQQTNGGYSRLLDLVEQQHARTVAPADRDDSLRTPQETLPG